MLTKTKKRINPMNDELKINEYLTKTFNTEKKNYEINKIIYQIIRNFFYKFEKLKMNKITSLLFALVGVLEN